LSSSAPPTLSSRQVADVDRLAQERFGISVEWLMEAAGWQVARFCRSRTAVVCGVGNNAGDGLAAARHLHRWGQLSAVSCIDAVRLRGAAAAERDALGKLGVDVSTELKLDGADVVLDALFGTGLSRAPEGRFAAWIEAINASQLHVIAIDVPSGLDADTGVAYSPCMRANTTVTLGLAKPGLLKGDGPAHAGDVWVTDIGVPFEAYAAIGVVVSRDLFANSDTFRLNGTER
jgi:NAD(P)H-hydrate epimerase